MNSSSNASTRPIHEIKVGLIRAAIWKNSATDNQRPWYSATVNRSYKAGDEWKVTSSFGHSDLLELAKVADLAHTWILSQQRPEGSGHEAQEDTPEAAPPIRAGNSRPMARR